MVNGIEMYLSNTCFITWIQTVWIFPKMSHTIAFNLVQLHLGIFSIHQLLQYSIEFVYSITIGSCHLWLVYMTRVMSLKSQGVIYNISHNYGNICRLHNAITWLCVHTCILIRYTCNFSLEFECDNMHTEYKNDFDWFRLVCCIQILGTFKNGIDWNTSR